MELEEQPTTAPIIDLLTGLTSLVDRLAQAQLPLTPSVVIHWDRFDLALDENTITLRFDDLQIDWPQTAGLPVRGDLNLVLRDAVLQPTESFFFRYETDLSQAELIEFQRLEMRRSSITVSWLEPQINYWLDRVVPGLADQGDTIVYEVALQIIFGEADEPLVREVRFDWTTPSERTYTFPGQNYTLPAATSMSLLVQGNPLGGLRFAICGTPPQGEGITTESTFAWGRGDDRELQNDENRDSLSDPLSVLRIAPKEGATTRTLVLFDSAHGAGSGLQSLQQLTAPLAPIDLDDEITFGTFTDLDTLPASDDNWQSTFELATGSSGFVLPMLQGSATSSQQMRIDAATTGPQPVALDGGSFRQEFKFQVQIGPLTINTLAIPQFNLGSFAFQVNHDKGMALLVGPDPIDFPEKDHLGLYWRFTGKEITEGPNKGRFHLFNLVTQGYNYQIRQAPGARLTLSYNAISDEPLTFEVSDFALTPKGVSLDATVTSTAVRLRGLDTRFSFRDSGIQIVDNDVKDIRLIGTGALPPDLVGDASADIRLEFRQTAGRLVLYTAEASLRGIKPLKCEGTRFQFAIERLGLKFVDEGNFHLYFTLTGSAQFVLAPDDDRTGPLAWLPEIRIELMEAPLAGDVSVLARHIKFLVDLPSPRTFSFFGCFEMELRAIGFMPQADVFDGDGAMQLGGQLRFAQGEGDHINNRRDYHLLLLGLPKLGTFKPRVYFKQLAVSLSIGEAFSIEAVVNFDEGADIQGFGGEGKLQLQGMPTLEAAFSFVRVRREADSVWVRAWFIALNVRRLSLLIPIVQIYIREIGFGFGYRYTLVAIREADRVGTLPELIRSLDKVSRTQGDLAKRDRWAVDVEGPGENLRWTVALRAMIAQNSASVGITYIERAEAPLQCLFLFDVLIAFRSDLTFYMAARGWINSNYHDYSTIQDLRDRPLVSGYILLSPRHKRFLARVISNPNGSFGTRPALPEFVEKALKSIQFSATLLIEPGLIHYELGWPNRLRWALRLGPLTMECRGGFIFRVEYEGDERILLIGNSYEAYGKLNFRAEIDAGFAGAALDVNAEVSYGTRMIGVVSSKLTASAFYGHIHLAIHVDLSLSAWVGAGPFKWKGRVSVGVSVTVSLEVAFNGPQPLGFGLVGEATVAFRVMGRNLGITVGIDVRKDNVTAVRNRVSVYEQRGVEGMGVPAGEPPPDLLNEALDAQARTQVLGTASATAVLGAGGVELLETPHYTVFVIHSPVEGWSHFVIFPNGEAEPGAVRTDRGFLPVPPDPSVVVDHDFNVIFPAADPSFELYHLRPTAATPSGNWEAYDSSDPLGVRWSANWEAVIRESDESAPNAPTPRTLTLREYLTAAFIPDASGRPASDPEVYAGQEQSISDERTHNPTDNDFDAAVRGAFTQFSGAPFFRVDPSNKYDRALSTAYTPTTTIYDQSGTITEANEATVKAQRHAEQFRSLIIEDIVADLRDYVADPQNFDRSRAVAFQLGLVFRFKGPTPPWLGEPASERIAGPFPTISQRIGSDAPAPVAASAERQLRVFNIPRTSFKRYPPAFARVRWYGSAQSIALTWDLTWDHLSTNEATAAQIDPNHHLAYYQVRRRALDSAERDHVFNTKPADVLHREAGDDQQSLLKFLRPRFQVVDQFVENTPNERASIPPEGLRYLYTITPYDYAGEPGRPLTLVARRFASDPPQAPIEAEFIVRYEMSADRLEVLAPHNPPIFLPTSVAVEWTRPIPPREGPAVPVAKYRMVFRRESTIPAGSYGLDSATQGDRPRPQPAGSARPLPTDLILEIGIGDQLLDAMQDRRSVTLTLATLREVGVLPETQAARWRPESWQIFIQAIGVNGVPSSLSSVAVVIRAATVGLVTERVEERRPAVLEWLTCPLRFELLPPEDQAVRTGSVHVPMPGLGARFDGTLGAVSFQPHPETLRAIRFRWNQGPSAQPDYPLALHAGFHLLELDADAHTSETLEQADTLANALRYIQEVQLIDDDDLSLVPGDTLATSRWEAWYASEIQRRAGYTPPPGAEIARTPWYSWRESLLEWPPWPGVTELQQANGTAQRTSPHHPLLITLLQQLAKQALLDQQAVPPTLAANFAAFMATTAPKADPYGWAVLQQLGLSVTFTLRDPVTRLPLPQTAALALVHKVITAMLINNDMCRYMHIELLFQPGQAIALQPVETKHEALLAIIQVSLRPIVRQVRRYSSLTVSGPTGTQASIVVDIAPNTMCSVIVPSDPASGQQDLKREGGPAPTITVRALQDTPAKVLLRTIELPGVALLLGEQPTGPLPVGFAAYERIGTGQKLLRIVQSWEGLSREQRDQLRTALGAGDKSIADLTITPAVEFLPTDANAALFSIGSDDLITILQQSEPAYAKPWLEFRRYIEALNITPESSITVPSSSETLKALFTELLAWTQRFFDHGGEVNYDPTRQLRGTSVGPWLATAYPEPATPAYAAPDAAGRLTYTHLIADRWAHTLRYYILPYGRYDRLWENILSNLRLRPASNPDRRVTVAPDPQAAALDVVLERTAPLAMPIVLRSGRLDESALLGAAVPPGRTWEVIIAQHPEQALVMHNQTMARRLEYRQIAFTLLRRFAYAWWAHSAFLGLQEEQLAHVIEAEPDLPGSYPEPLDHITTTPPANETARADQRSLDLPMRVADFDQGVMAIQWDGLPFYYEHRLLLVAQTDYVHSAINEVTQSDFEYRAPEPHALVSGFVRTPWVPALLEQPGAPSPEGHAIVANTSPSKRRGRLIRFTLASFWDSLTDDARRRWPGENPTVQRNDDVRSLSSLPDPEVVYQIVERFGGNIEVQAEFFFDGNQETVEAVTPTTATNQYRRRRLGRRLQAEEPVLEPPHAPNAPYMLRTVLYDQLNQSAPDHPTIAQYCTEPISQTYNLADLSSELRELVNIPEPDSCFLVWDGPMSDEDRAALLELPGDEPFRSALARLARQATAEGGVMSVPTALGVDQRPAAVPDTLQVTIDTTANRYTAVTWTGPLAVAERDALAPVLRRWGQIPAFATALDTLLSAVEGREIVLPIPAGRPKLDDLPPELYDVLLIMPGILRWSDNAPSDMQRDALAILEADQAFLDAIAALLAAYDGGASVPFPAEEGEVEDPLSGLAAGLQERLSLIGTGAARQLSWQGQAPNDEERSAFQSAIEDSTLAQTLRAALDALLIALDAPRETPLSDGLARPDQIPAPLSDQLLIQLNQIVWTGPARSAEQVAALRSFAAEPFDEPLQTALLALADELELVPITIACDLPIRPVQSSLGSLGERLLIGRAVFRFRGIMTPEEARDLAHITQLPIDRAAVRRLYACSINSGLRGREILVRARRGNATPSELRKLMLEPFDQETE